MEVAGPLLEKIDADVKPHTRSQVLSSIFYHYFHGHIHKIDPFVPKISRLLCCYFKCWWDGKGKGG